MAVPGKNKILAKDIYQYLMTKPNMTNTKALGIIANIKAESDFYIDAVEIGDNIENKGIGLFQHTFKTRKEALIEAVPDWKTNWKAQIDFALQESEAQNYLNTTYNSVADSTKAFMLEFEKPKDQSNEAIQKRINGLKKINTVDVPNNSGSILQSQEVEYKVYDTKTNQYTTFSSSYNSETQSWTHSAEGDSYTQNEIDEIGNMYNTPLGSQPNGKTSTFKEEEFEDGTKYYRPYFGEGNEQSEFQKRFAFIGEKPIQLKTDIKELEKLSKLESEKNIEKSKESLDKRSDTDPALEIQNNLIEKINQANKKYLATQKPEDKKAADDLQKELDSLNKEINKNESPLANLTQKDLRLREQLDKMQKNSDDFTTDDILSIQRQLNKVYNDIQIEQGYPATDPPFKNIPKEEYIDLEVKEKYGLGDEVYESSEEIKQSNVLDDVVIKSDISKENINTEEEKEEKKDIDETPPVTNLTKTFGDLGNVIGDSLGLVNSVRDLINGPDDLIRAALGEQAFKESMKEVIPQELPELSNQFKQHLAQVQNLSKQGFSVAEANKAKQDIDAAYKQGIENTVRGTSGDRAKFLAMSGVLDQARSSALLEFAAKDAELNRANQAAYTNALSFGEEYNLNKSTTEASQQLQLDLEKKRGASEFAKEAFKGLNERIGPAGNQYLNTLQSLVRDNQNPYSLTLETPGTTTNTGGN